jgi:hypothetical protein
MGRVLWEENEPETEKKDKNRLGKTKGDYDLTLRYKPLISPSEDMALTALNLDAPLLSKGSPIMYLAIV